MLSKDDVDKMVRDAQEHAEEDKTRREEVEVRNQAEQLTYQAERTLADLGDKVPAEDRAEVERQVETLREALKGSDIAAVKSGMDALVGTLSRIGAAAYQAASPMDGPGQPGPDGSDGTGGEGGGEAAAEGEPAGAGARSGSSGSPDSASDDAVEGEYKEV
jgi:molecular chaperone DnaK